MTDKEYGWMLLMFGLMRISYIAEFLIWKGELFHNSNFSFFISSEYVFYPLMGYYIDQRIKKENFTQKKALLLSIASVLAIIFCCFMTHYKCTLNNEWIERTCQTFFGTLIFLPTITVYYIVKMWFINHDLNKRICQMIATIGETTFGIYLIEQICRNKTKFIFDWLKPYIHTLPACWIWILTACIFGAGITLLFRKIPGVKRFI